MDRRAFLRHLAACGGSVALAPVLDACARLPAQPPSRSSLRIVTPAVTGPSSPVAGTPPPASATPSSTAVETVVPPGTVALVRTTDRAAGVRRALELLGANPVRGRQVLLKPNLNSADPAPGSTHPDVLRELLAALADLGASGVTIADRSGMGDTSSVMRRTGALDLAAEFGAAVQALGELPEDAWTLVRRDGDHWPHGFPIPRLVADAECVVQTCNLKTHRFGGHFTLSLKNSVGLVGRRHAGHDYMDDLHDGEHQRRMIAEVNAVYAPALVVIDGVEAFTSGGPDRGTRANAGVVLAGSDRVALDAVGVAILRLLGTTPEVSRGRVFEQEQIARAVELGLGVGRPEDIRFVTGDAEGAAFVARLQPLLTA